MAVKTLLVAALAAVSSASPLLDLLKLVARQDSNSSDLESYITQQFNISLTGAIANIGGTNDSIIGNGPSAGVVVASPSDFAPNYFYTWTRDSALTMLMLVDQLRFGTESDGNNTLQTILEDYTTAQANLQTVTNPSGTLYPDGQGLGEPKFYTNLTRFDSTWGRPQNDGPALRAVTLMETADAVYRRNDEATAQMIVSSVYWPIILNDLKYVAQWWNTTSYELWEEVNGNSFFTTTAQHRALVEGAAWAERLNQTCDACTVAPQILCFLQANFWNETGNYILANINANQVNRSQINADPLLASMYNFDINATCDALSTQPCNSRILATHKVWVDSFRNLYPINNNATAPNAVACGRYPEDTYYDGNPWYITTAAAAETLYDAVAQMNAQGSYTIDDTSLPFFTDLLPNITAASYSGDALTDITNAMTTYADGFMDIIRQYTPENGSLSEQINKTSGEPISAYDLTWSYASFVTAVQRRSGQYPPSWGANGTSANNISDTCEWTSYNSTFTYAAATAAGAPSPQTYNGTACLGNVLFEVLAPTMFGQNVYIAGNASILGNTLDDQSEIILPMKTGNITADSPTWWQNLWFEAGTNVEYIYALQNGTDLTYTFENITRTVAVPECGSGTTLRTSDTASFPNTTMSE